LTQYKRRPLWENTAAQVEV